MNYCDRKGIGCEYAGYHGYCTVTACMKINYDVAKSLKEVSQFNFCEICDGMTEDSQHHICKKCGDKLYQILYGKDE